jgi:hypothetical protein
MDETAILAYFRARLAREEFVTFDVINEAINDNPFSLSESDLDLLKRKLQASFTIMQKEGSSVLSEYKPWLDNQKSKLDFYYWNRLRDYLLTQDILPPNVISTLDSVTDDILDYSGNPIEEGLWSRRGMVMGHVQSGKTTNYSALICKAADAGYKIIILLAGITNSLRTQTQERIDESFIGKKSIFQSTVTQELSILNFCDENRFPVYGTSRDKDFHKSITQNYGVSLAALSEPIIFVTKKNKSILQNLKDWIRGQNHGDSVTEPLLLIDDEADNASINTSSDPSRSTAINHHIRDILQTFTRSTYIGYTATPFANIFIDPSSNSEMIGDELFPRHFIKSLDPPTNYVGATRIFTDEGNLRNSMVRIIDDYGDILPLKHKKDLDLTVLPPSLLQAVRVFLLTRAVRYLRGEGTKHCTMMINVSRFNDVQELIEGLVYDYLQNLVRAITVNARHRTGNSDPLITALRNDYECEFSELDHSVDEILEVLHEATSTVGVTTVNMRGGHLDYAMNSTNGLHVIVVGGLALSRGLTLEGLTVSYMLRNASASDTLMQMARWFGYRPDYDRICRLYISQGAYDHYEQITDAIEELRSEVRVMEQLGQTPEEFGLKVRQSPTGIKITAANKMRSATELRLAQDYSQRHIEGHAIFNERELNRKHISLLKGIFNELPSPIRKDEYPFWTDVPGSIVAPLIQAFVFPAVVSGLAKISGNRSLIDDYISDRIGHELSTWDIAVPVRKMMKARELSDFVPGVKLNLRERRKGIIENNVFRVNGKKNRIVDLSDSKIGLTAEQINLAESMAKETGARGDQKFCAVRENPLLLIHVFHTGRSDIAEGDPICSLSILFPSTGVSVRERKYQVNEVFRQAMRQEADSEEDDDERLLEEN